MPAAKRRRNWGFLASRKGISLIRNEIVAVGRRLASNPLCFPRLENHAFRLNRPSLVQIVDEIRMLVVRAVAVRSKVRMIRFKIVMAVTDLVNVT